MSLNILLENTISDDLEDLFGQVMIANTVGGVFYGVLMAIEVVVLYMTFSSTFRPTKPRLVLLFISLIVVSLSSVHFALSMYTSLIGFRVLKISMLQNQSRLIRSLKYLIGDAVVAWRAWVMVKGRSRIALSTVLLGSIGRYTQRSLEAYTIEPCPSSSGMNDEFHLTRNKIRRILLVLVGSGLLYVVGWIYSVVTNVGLLSDDGKFFEEAFLPHIAVGHTPSSSLRIGDIPEISD
ncbi:hypothetical protein K435DRAFT_802288 [Dendrothele bispora CBS 962.96]|uniref:Uncharacterized protein n=1 Tax=Dendrothele bispora (strain CBS 962.96) TaxID=1314807 RepID=A0A4V4HE76_DENBC|nr:hypothetical protein K435DRAFT_802288 [Dendrothele bispora CBS 962.96]